MIVLTGRPKLTSSITAEVRADTLALSHLPMGRPLSGSSATLSHQSLRPLVQELFPLNRYLAYMMLLHHHRHQQMWFTMNV